MYILFHLSSFLRIISKLGDILRGSFPVFLLFIFFYYCSFQFLFPRLYVSFDPIFQIAAATQHVGFLHLNSSLIKRPSKLSQNSNRPRAINHATRVKIYIYRGAKEITRNERREEWRWKRNGGGKKRKCRIEKREREGGRESTLRCRTDDAATVGLIKLREAGRSFVGFVSRR